MNPRSLASDFHVLTSADYRVHASPPSRGVHVFSPRRSEVKWTRDWVSLGEQDLICLEKAEAPQLRVTE